MITGPLKNSVDAIWNAFWSGGVSNPMTVVEQFTYLLFIRQLDESQDRLDQQKSLGVPVKEEDNIFSTEQQDLRWKNLLAETGPEKLKDTVQHGVFPFLRNLGGSGMNQHMRTASYGIDNPNTLRTVMTEINKLEINNKDLLGDLYEYLLSQLSTSGKNGQFRTPQHIIQLMTVLMAPKPGERVIDPACGTAGFLVNAAEYVKHNHGDSLLKKDSMAAFYEDSFYGYDFDATMVRISAMNMFMHGFAEPNIAYRDSLGTIPDNDKNAFDVVLANPPFKGSVDANNLDKALTSLAATKKTELLFINRFLSLMKIGGRAAVIVPEGVLFGATRAHVAIRKELIDNQKLDAVIKLPSGVFKPYSGVSTAILCFTRTDSKATDNVWFYELQADGYSLDDKRTALLDAHLLGPTPAVRPQEPGNPQDRPDAAILAEEQHNKNNLPDVISRFNTRASDELNRARTEQSFCVPVQEIVDNGYDLSMNRYKEIVFEDVETRDPLDIIADIEALDQEIATNMAAVKKLLGGAQ